MRTGKYVIVLVCVLFLSSFTMAFDGNRKGFVIGGGLGLGFLSTWKLNDKSIDESGAGIGGNMIFGYAWDERNIASWQLNGNSHDIDSFDRQGIQFFTGPTWYHYFNDRAGSVFSTLGFWQYAVWEVGEGYHATGWATLVGLGYEFARHFQIGVYYSHAWTENADNSSEKGSNNHLNFLLTIMAY